MNIDVTPYGEGDPPNVSMRVALAMNRKLSETKVLALNILALRSGQEWAHITHLKRCGVMLRTLMSLRDVDGMIQSAEASSYWRITSFGSGWLDYHEKHK